MSRSGGRRLAEVERSAGDHEVCAYIWTCFQKRLYFSYPTGQQCFNMWDYNMSFVWDPQVHVNQDAAVTVDARTANPIPVSILIPTTPDVDTSTGWRTVHCRVPDFELVHNRVSRNDSDIPLDWLSGARAIGSNGVPQLDAR